MNVRLDLFRAQTHKTTFFFLSKSQLDSPSHFTSNLSPEAVENLKQELSSTKVTLHLDYKQSFFFLGPSSKTRETRKWPRAWLMARDAFYFLVRLLLSSTLARAFTPLTKSEEKRETARRLHFTYFGVLGKCFSLQLLNQKSCYFCQ